MLKKGDMVAGFRIDGVVAEGGMSVIYRATQESLKRTIALKVVPPELSGDPDFRERFRREGALQATIDHPHIVSVHEAGESEHGLFLAMRLITGPTLKDKIYEGKLDPRSTVVVLSQVAEALDAAHEVGLIHRDVKPQNVLIGEGDHAYLADFGLGKAVDEAPLTATGQFMGTIDYVSPEQARSEGVTARSDVYQLAAVLYECLCGVVPFDRPNDAAVLFAHITEPPPRLAESCPNLPPRLGDAISSGMAKNPADRPATPGELMEQAREALGIAWGRRRVAPGSPTKASDLDN